VGKPAVAEASSDAQKNHVGGSASAASTPQIASPAAVGKPAVAEASSDGQNHVGGPASASSAPQIASLNASPAAVGKPAVAEASSDVQNHVGDPASTSAGRISSLIRIPRRKGFFKWAKSREGFGQRFLRASGFIS